MENESRRIFNAKIDVRLTKYLQIAATQNNELSLKLIAGTKNLSVSVDTLGKGVATVGGSRFSFDADAQDFSDLTKFEHGVAKIGFLSINASVTSSRMLGFSVSLAPPGAVNRMLGRFGGGVALGFEISPVNSVLFNSGMLGNAAQLLQPEARKTRLNQCIDAGKCN